MIFVCVCVWDPSGFSDPQSPAEGRGAGRGSPLHLIRSHSGSEADLQRGRSRHAQHPVRISPGTFTSPGSLTHKATSHTVTETNEEIKRLPFVRGIVLLDF